MNITIRTHITELELVELLRAYVQSKGFDVGNSEHVEMALLNGSGKVDAVFTGMQVDWLIPVNTT